MKFKLQFLMQGHRVIEEVMEDIFWRLWIWIRVRGITCFHWTVLKLRSRYDQSLYYFF